MDMKVLLSKVVKSIDYYRFPNTCTTVCCILCKNGYSVVGCSHALDPDTFNEEMGKEVAKENAERELLQVLAYAVKDDAV